MKKRSPRHLSLIAGIVFLLVATYGIIRNTPDTYVVFLVLGFMFLFQGLNDLRLRKKG
jgi:uncharacterized membrane protein HdeD (DUF308 family)